MGDDEAFTPKEGYGQEIFSGLTREVIRLDAQRVVKRGSLRHREVDALKFVAANTTIPVPKVYQARIRKPGETSEIVMDYMPGETLESVWLTLSHDSKVSICQQLGGYLAQLKKLKGKRIEGVNGAPISVGIRYPRDGGPFDTEREFNAFLLDDPDIPISDALKYFSSACLLEDHEIQFAHADFAPRNVLVDKEAGNVTAILDWEVSGFYPEYWDVIRLVLDRNYKTRGFLDYFHYIHPYKYAQKYVAMRQVLRVTEHW